MTNKKLKLLDVAANKFGPRRSRLKFFFLFCFFLLCCFSLFFFHIDSTQTINVICFCLRACFTFYFASIDFLYRSFSFSHTSIFIRHSKPITFNHNQVFIVYFVYVFLSDNRTRTRARCCSP